MKFYVTDPAKLHEELTRYQFYLQIKKDMYTTRLPCTFESAALLASYMMQGMYAVGACYYRLVYTCGNSTACLATKQEACCSPLLHLASLLPPLLHLASLLPPPPPPP